MADRPEREREHLLTALIIAVLKGWILVIRMIFINDPGGDGGMPGNEVRDPNVKVVGRGR